MQADIEGPITAKAEQTRTKFRALLDKTNKENPQPKDVTALADLLSGNTTSRQSSNFKKIGRYSSIV